MKCIFSVSVLLVLTFIVEIIATDIDNNEEQEIGVFGPLLEEWALMLDKNGYREHRVMKLPPTQGGFVASTANGNSLKLVNVTNDLGKVINNNQTTSRPTKPQQRPVLKPSIPGENGRQVSETDLYLLGAIEKLVYRVDFMEKRLRKVEEMLHYTVAGNKIDRDPCPENFSRVGDNCYHFGERRLDWKIASKLCMRMGTSLVELENNNEKLLIISFIQSSMHLRGKDFWTGGLNPGLLWIWSNSARPVVNKSGENASDIRGKGRCLGLIYEPPYRNYAYRGQDCSVNQFFICEMQDRSVSNEISRIEKQLGLNGSNN